MHVINLKDFNPAPFPENLPTIDLPKVSLKKLINNDEGEARRVFEICTRTGFFYLDMMDHPKGRKMIECASASMRVGKEVMPQMQVEEKRTYKKRPRVGVLDMGYNCAVTDDEGQPKYLETINIPQYEMFTKEATDFKLPWWLADYEDNFRDAMREGNDVANVIFGILEGQLQLPGGSLTSIHRLMDSSNDFLRILRYPGLEPGRMHDQPSFPPHRDAVSIAILFTWLGGLQIPKIDPEMTGPDRETEESWRWVKPLPGHAIVNLGDAMSILTNNVLKSGKHRVVTAPGQQAQLDRYSVLIAARPADQTPMKPFKSPMIPEDGPQQRYLDVMTSQEWGNYKVQKFYTDNNRGTGR